MLENVWKYNGLNETGYQMYNIPLYRTPYKMFPQSTNMMKWLTLIFAGRSILPPRRPGLPVDFPLTRDIRCKFDILDLPQSSDIG